MYIPNKLNKLKIEKSNKNLYSTSYKLNTDITEDIIFSSQKYSFRISRISIPTGSGNENDIGRYAELPNTASVFNGIFFTNTTIFQENNPTFNFTRALFAPGIFYVQITNLNTNEIIYKEYCGKADKPPACTLPQGNFLIEFIQE